MVYAQIRVRKSISKMPTDLFNLQLSDFIANNYDIYQVQNIKNDEDLIDISLHHISNQSKCPPHNV